ncbi:MAG: TraB/GumN family protein [Sphingomonadaceae bacterium]|nr:TraB/GumN family protein [Sphingomonadaceae bacterium]
MFWRPFHILAGLIALSSLAAAPAMADIAPPHASASSDTQLEQGAPQPAIWLLSDSDTRIWLFGTTHVLPSNFAWRSPDLDAIIAEVDELVLETSDEEVLAKPSLISGMMEREAPLSILSRISPEYRYRLQLMVKGLPIALEQLDGLETWAVGFLLIGMSSGDIYGDPETGGELSGVEEQLTEIFTGIDKPISGVETSLGQLGFLRSISEDGQREFLEALVETAVLPEEGEEEIDPVRDPWVSGDVAMLDSECDNEQNFPPELQEVLLRQRNLNWIEWLIDRLDRPGDVLFAVGACHLAGSVSVQSMLAERGLSAERVH